MTANAAVRGTHGTTYAYRNGCRCDQCRAANTAAQMRWRDKARERPMPARAHGTVNGYKIYGCRCEECQAANAATRQRSRGRKARMRRLVELGLPRNYEGDI